MLILIEFFSIQAVICPESEVPAFNNGTGQGTTNLMELKKTAESLKDSFAEEGNPLKEIRPELEEAANSLKNQLQKNIS